MRQIAFARSALLVIGILAPGTVASPKPPESQPGIKTDRGTYLPIPAVKLPKSGGTFVDPTFGAEILWATDETDGPRNQNAYSY